MSEKKDRNILTGFAAPLLFALLIGVAAIIWAVNSGNRVNDATSGNKYPLVINNGSGMDNGGSSDQNTAGSVVNSSEVAPCPDVQQASQLITLNSSGLVREGGENGGDVCLFEWRAPLAPSDTVTCPDGWQCELDIAGPTEGQMYFGGGGQYQIDAGSFRLVAAYTAGDPIHNSCSVLENSRNHLKFEGVTDWQMNPGNFSCNGESAPRPSTSKSDHLNCPNFGGVETTPIGDGGCKYGPTNIVTSEVPSDWTALYWDGSTTQHASPGDSITTGEASFYPEGADDAMKNIRNVALAVMLSFASLLPATHEAQAGRYCPLFSQHQTHRLADNGCKLGPLNRLIVGRVPRGWHAIYWNGSAVRRARSGMRIKTSEATFYRNGS